MTKIEEIEAVWREFDIQETGRDMSNECRLANAIISLRVTARTQGNRCGKCQKELLDEQKR